MFVRNGLILALIPPDSHGHSMSCMIMGDIVRAASADDIHAALSSAFGRQPEPGGGRVPLWYLEGGQLMVVTVADGTVLVTCWYPRNSAR
jgi:hypothetical protein